MHDAPRFDIIEEHPPRPEALALGTLVSLLMLAAFMLSFRPTELPEVPAYLGAGPGSGTPGVDSDAPALPAAGPNRGKHHQLIAAIAAHIRHLYVDRAIGGQLADTLLALDRGGEYDALEMDAGLAARINDDIQRTVRLLGLPRGMFVADVLYSERPLPTGPPPPMTAEMRERNRALLLQQNCLFDTVETLPDSIGYVKLNGFAEAAVCQETTGRVMASLNNAAALIIDLRDNGGGFGETALQIAGYLFDRPAFMYDPRPSSPVPSRTASPIPNNTLADKPVYILTSSRTQSAAEYFVYNLKMLKRATVVGETTAGRQHSGAFHRITDHFGLGIQETAPPDNPYPVKGWEVVGVEPDVNVSWIDAFGAARTLAEDRMRRR